MQVPYTRSIIDFGRDDESVERSLAQGIVASLEGRIPNGEVTLKPMKIRQEGDEVTYDLADWSSKYDGKSFIASFRDAQDRNDPRNTKGSFEVGFNTDMSQVLDQFDKKELVLGSHDPVPSISFILEDSEEFVEALMDEYSNRIKARHTAIKIDEPVIESLITRPRLLGQRTWRSTFLPEVTLTGVIWFDLDKTDIQPAVDAVLTLRVEEMNPSQLDSDAESEAKEEEVQGSSEKDDDWSPQALTAATQRLTIE